MRRFVLFLWRWRFFILVLLLTLTLRITLLFINDFNIGRGDTDTFLTYAKSISEHFAFSESVEPPFLPTAGTTPIFPVFIAITSLVWGLPEIYTVYCLMFIDFLSAIIIFKICMELFNNIKIAKISTILFVLCPAIAQHSVALMAETLSIFFTLYSMYFLIKFFNDKEKTIYLILCSFFLALNALDRSNYALLPLAFAGTFFLKKGLFKEKVKKSVLLIMLYGAFISPWIIRNIITQEEFTTFRRFDGPYESHNTLDFYPYRLWLTTWMYSGKDIQFYWRITKSVGRHISEVNYAFSDEEEKTAILSVISNHEKNGFFSKEDQKILTNISIQKIKKAPITYYLLLPLKRTIFLWRSHQIFYINTDNIFIKSSAALINLFFYFGFLVGIALFFKEIPHLVILLSLLFYSSFFHGFLRIYNAVSCVPRYAIQSFSVLVIITGFSSYKILQRVNSIWLWKSNQD